ncbi:MAG: hypothetical protein PF517_17390 [Salinivirgaceae bacterium]|jgi:hypothetical protein|nr:hypothetical protein [Salinivirgaceae bacterium]
MKVNYDEIMNSIIKGLLNGNEDKVIGQMLLQTDHPIGELINNDQESFEKIYAFLSPTAFSVLAELKNQLGDDLQILDDDGSSIDFE